MPLSSQPDDVLSVIKRDGTVNPRTDPRLSDDVKKQLYRAMVRTRVIDGQLEKLQRQGRIGFHIGSLGEEACILGSAAAFAEGDFIFPCYREFGALLWRGMPLQSYVDNMYGNNNDVVKGRQMPDHYSGKPYGYGSVSSPIGTQMSQAVGYAWAGMQKADRAGETPPAVGVYFGEGATSSNDFHTGMNFAGVFKTPTLFLLRNNRWAISVPAERQTASDNFAVKGVAYGVPGIRVDGNDILACYAATQGALEHARSGGGPTLIEFLTYRLGGHSTSDDPRAYRAESEVEEWRKTDPIVRLRTHLESSMGWSETDEETLKQEVEAELRACIKRAEETSRPALSTLFNDVYEEQPWHLREQQEVLERGPRTTIGH